MMWSERVVVTERGHRHLVVNNIHTAKLKHTHEKLEKFCVVFRNFCALFLLRIVATPHVPVGELILSLSVSV